MVSFRIMRENIEKSQKVSPWVWRAFWIEYLEVFILGS